MGYGRLTSWEDGEVAELHPKLNTVVLHLEVQVASLHGTMAPPWVVRRHSSSQKSSEHMTGLLQLGAHGHPFTWGRR